MPGTLSRRTFLANAAAVPAATLMTTGAVMVAQPTVTTGSLIEAERGVIRSAMKGSGIGAAAVCLVEGGQVRWSEGFDCCSPAMAKRWIFAAPSRHGATCACSASRPWTRGDGGMPRAHPRRSRPSML